MISNCCTYTYRVSWMRLGFQAHQGRIGLKKIVRSRPNKAISDVVFTFHENNRCPDPSQRTVRDTSLYIMEYFPIIVVLLRWRTFNAGVAQTWSLRHFAALAHFPGFCNCGMWWHVEVPKIIYFLLPKKVEDEETKSQTALGSWLLYSVKQSKRFSMTLRKRLAISQRKEKILGSWRERSPWLWVSRTLAW